MDSDPESEAAALLTDAVQILDVVRREWAAEGQWSKWDQGVRDRITEWLKAHYERATA